MERGKAEAAVAHSDCGNTVPARHAEVRVPVDLRIIVCVEIDPARSANQSTRIEHLLALTAVDTADLSDLAVLNTNIAFVPRDPRAIDDRSVFDNDIILCHKSLLPILCL